MRVKLVCLWFYYIPFVALSLNFIVPYFVAKSREAVESTMGDDYVDWLE